MTILREKIDITPDKSLYPKLGQTGYSVGEAIAEIVDNAIDERFDDRLVSVNVEINQKRGFAKVEDDARGMDKETASKSIILARSEKKEGKLGQFGLGLKTACASLGKKFTVETTQEGSDEEYRLVFDEEEFLKTGGWKDFEIEIKKGADKKRSGTKIFIEELRFRFYPQLIKNIEKQLRERFTPFIENKEAKIRLNGKLIKTERPELAEGSEEKFRIKLSGGATIKGKAGILKKGTQEKSGFNLYRHDRLIRAHEKLGYQYHPSKMWITGEVHLDCIPVTHNKREFITEDPLYVEFLEKFQESIKPFLAAAQKRHRENKIKDLPEEVKETLKDNILKALDRAQDFQEMAFPSGVEQYKRSETEGEYFEKEKRSPRKITHTKEVEIHRPATKARKSKTVQKKRVRFIIIAGQKYKFDYQWEEFEEEIPKVAEIDREKKMIMVTLNSHFPLLNFVKDQVLYISFYVTEGIVEVFLKENKRSLEKTVPLRDQLIKELSKIITEDATEGIDKKEQKMSEARIKILKDSLGNQEIKDALTAKEYESLKMRLGLGEDSKKLEEIGDRLNVTRERARQLVNQALSKVSKFVLEEATREEIEEKIVGDEAYDFKTRIEDLNFSTRTLNALSRIGIRTIGGLARKRKQDLLKIRGLGESGANEIKETLSRYQEFIKK